LEYYLGLDQSLANTGWSVIQLDKGSASICEYGCFVTKPDKLLINRLLNIQDFILSVTNKYTIKLVFMEKVFAARGGMFNSSTLARVESAIQLHLVRNNIKFTIVESTKSTTSVSWRKEFDLPTGKKASKDYLHRIYPDLKVNEHEADSMLIAAAGFGYSLDKNPYNVFNSKPKKT
jgi:hypothetical protein